jgi:hypothetical protein
MFKTQILGSVFVVICSNSLINIMKMDIQAIYLTLLLDEALRALLNTYRFNRMTVLKSEMFNGSYTG